MDSVRTVEARPAGPDVRGVIMFGILLASYSIHAMDRQLFPLLAPEVRSQ